MRMITKTTNPECNLFLSGDDIIAWGPNFPVIFLKNNLTI